MNKEFISFWSGVTKDEKKLTPEEQLQFCEDFNQMLRTSPELAKIFFNTQVYNEIVNDVTTRGLHSEGVAIVAENLATQKAKLDGKSDVEAKVSGLLAKSLGYMHDLGHTPFGHDGEGALGTEMERFAATQDYKDKRKILFGDEYTIQAGDMNAETMCYEHNETSSVIGAQLLEKFAKENGYSVDEKSIQYIKTGILAHSTSRVKTEPQGVEQKAVRLADKVAYIPQDLLDLIKQGVLNIDDLSPEEQGLLGLNEKQITEKEKEEYEQLETDEDKEKYLDSRAKNKLNLKEKLRNIDKMPEKMKINLFKKLDVKVAEMQAEIAGKCFVEKDGEMIIDGRKPTVDFFDKFVNDGKTPKNHEITVREMQGISLFKKMRDAQKMPMDNSNRQSMVNETSRAYNEFLQNNYGIDPTLATLWVTKAKYQDAFIHGELSRVSQDKQGNEQKETLADINQKNNNGWKMKTTFQFFYSNIEQIPKEFRDKYNGENGEIYTEQQIVSAYIASFTNKGLNELYNGLVEKKLVLSREDAIAQLQEMRPDLDIESLTNKDRKWQDPQNPDATYKISANDILEFLYEEDVGYGIVSGKNQNPERIIPPIQHSIAVRDGVNATRDTSKQIREETPQLLVSAIDVSKTEVNSKDIQQMVASVTERQNTQEIQQHIDEVSKNEGR